MFIKIGKKETPELDAQIDVVLECMTAVTPDSPEYPQLLTQLERLHALKKDNKWRVTPDTVVSSAVTLLGILVMVGYEQNHAHVSKALNFIPKPK